MKNMIINRQRVVIRRPLLPDGSFRAAFLTDLHNACGPDETGKIMRALSQLSPDVILVGGDMLIARPGESAAPARDFMLGLADSYPVIAAPGNHEYRAFLYPEIYGPLYYDYTEPLKKAGVRFLDNSDLRMRLSGVPVRVIGYAAPREYYRRLNHPKMEVRELSGRFGKVREDEVTILLAHNPFYYRTYLRYGADLTLCGHYHGGVMQIGKNHGLVSPDFRIFPDNAHGMMRETGRGGARVFVGAGLGEHTIPFRVFNPREIAVLDFYCTHGRTRAGQGEKNGRN